MKNDEKILGLDLGTNSIGWAIVRRTPTECNLLKRGVLTFPKGVTMTKSGEEPSVKERTNARGVRTQNRHKRNRKISVLKVLIKYSLCPQISEAELKQWKLYKKYPLKTDFLQWQRTDDKIDKNPYHDRYQCLTRTLDFTIESERFILGRALYHIAQRRGFLSNRKDRTNESDGEVKKGIDKLSQEIGEAGCTYVGEYFYKLYHEGKKIRSRYSDRLLHYEKEFYAICDKQKIDVDIVEELHSAVFFQNPLKSQRGTVAHCTFEPSKKCCPISHPLYEEFKMLCFINNIKIKIPSEASARFLTDEEKNKIKHLFLRKSKRNFTFSDIAVELIGKKIPYASLDELGDYDYRFNFHKDTSVSGCQTIASIKTLFGNEWKEVLSSIYIKAEGKSQDDIVNDVWHVLYSFDKDQCIKDWAVKNLQLNEKEAESFAKIDVLQGYGSLSIKAIKKIIVFLRKGLRYDEAVLLANIKSVLPKYITEEEYQRIENNLIQEIYEFREGKYRKDFTKRDFIKSYLEDVQGVDLTKLDKLYHPSMIEAYEDAKPNKDGVVLLGSPRISSIRNPMAMRALFQLRHLINTLIKEGEIDQYTKVNIEFSRELNDANKRKAIQDIQKEKEKDRANAREEIKKYFFEEYGKEIEPTETDIDKYILWEEQGHICLYTSHKIGLSDFLGENPKYDIEHTVPRSRGGDNSLMNKTLCEVYFNRQVKRTKLPSQLRNYAEVMTQIETQKWGANIAKFEKEINNARTSPSMSKESKDKVIVKRHIAKMKLDYWRGKLKRFTMTEVPEGFSNRQGVDTGIITRYARLYLKSYFNKSDAQVFAVKGATTAEFRKLWGLQEEYSKKDRSTNSHHCIDAIVISCIGRREYQEWAEYKTLEENYKWNSGTKPVFSKPWATFTQDVKNVANELLVYSYTADNMSRKTKKVCKQLPLRLRNDKYTKYYSQGDSARGTLHDATFYGAIKRDDKTKYVVRKQLNSLKENEIKNIVDDVVKARIEQAVRERGFKNLCTAPVWMNEAKGVEIKKVRVYVPTVTNPISLKTHRDASFYEHKQNYYVVNDSNYCLCIYEGENKKGKTSRNVIVENNLEAAKRFQNKNPKQRKISKTDENGYILKYVLKIGTIVLFYENSPEELYNCSSEELRLRLYKIFGLKKDGRIKLTNLQESQNSDTIGGVWKQNETYRPSMIVVSNQFNAMIEGVHFKMSESGKITFFKK